MNLPPISLGPPVELSTQPAFARKSRKAAPQRGYAYENKVTRRLEKETAALGWELWTQQWLCEGGKYCCPDFVAISPSGAGIILEAKLTWKPTESQRAQYEEKLFLLGYPCFSVTVCKNLTLNVPQSLVVDSFLDLFPGAVWHLWL